MMIGLLRIHRAYFMGHKNYICINERMAYSTIDKELINYFTLLDEKQKETLLEMIKSFLKPGKT